MLLLGSKQVIGSLWPGGWGESRGSGEWWSQGTTPSSLAVDSVLSRLKDIEEKRA